MTFDKDWIEDRTEHEDALRATGFWGRRGAGCVFYARSTGRFMLSLRSIEVLEPFTWATWGGAVPEGMSPEEGVRREVWEEAGVDAHFDLVHVYRFEDAASGFVYENYIAVVDEEFEPVLDDETEDYLWVEPGKWPSPLHFGMKTLLENVPDLSARVPAVGSHP